MGTEDKNFNDHAEHDEPPTNGGKVRNRRISGQTPDFRDTFDEDAKLAEAELAEEELAKVALEEAKKAHKTGPTLVTESRPAKKTFLEEAQEKAAEQARLRSMKPQAPVPPVEPQAPSPSDAVTVPAEATIYRDAVFIPQEEPSRPRAHRGLGILAATATAAVAAVLAGTYYLEKHNRELEEPIVVPASPAGPNPKPVPAAPVQPAPSPPVKEEEVTIFRVECSDGPDKSVPIYGEFDYKAIEERPFTWVKNEAGQELWGIHLEGHEPFNPDVWTLCETDEDGLLELKLQPLPEAPSEPPSEHETIPNR